MNLLVTSIYQNIAHWYNLSGQATEKPISKMGWREFDTSQTLSTYGEFFIFLPAFAYNIVYVYLGKSLQKNFK